MDKDLTDAITNTLLRHTMLSVAGDAFERTPVVLMVSGGSDSVALARLLPQLCGQTTCTILHVNHQLRGAEADGDEAFVVALAQELGLPCEVRRFDVAGLARENGTNTEHAGREVRYRAAEELCDRLCAEQNIAPGLGRIATAHTLDDRVETFFMRTIVGAGAKALSSIPYTNGRVIRPLLDVTRRQLRTWLAVSASMTSVSGISPKTKIHSRSVGVVGARSRHCGAASPATGIAPNTGAIVVGQGHGAGEATAAEELWREDATNRDTDKLRAFVRHELIPLAITRNPELLATVAQSLDNLALDDRLLTKLAAELENRLVSRERDGILRVDGALFDEDEALIGRIVHSVCKKVLPAKERITSHHVKNIVNYGLQHGFAIDLPGAASVANVYGALYFHPPKKAGEIGSTADRGWHLDVRLGDTVLLPDGRKLEFTEVDPALYADDPVSYVRKRSSPSRTYIDAAAVDFCFRGNDGGGREGGSGLRGDGGDVHGSDAILTLTLSPLDSGDRFCPLGMGGRHKLVSDVLVDRKIPKSKRSQLLKATVGEGDCQAIVWLVDIQLDERFKVSDATSTMLSILVSCQSAAGRA